jgi:hypothetical protein
MRLSDAQFRSYEFEPVELTFIEGQHTNLFSLKNNKTLRQTIEHPKYAKFFDEVTSHHTDDLDKPLGRFLLDLKAQGNKFYRRFLNRHGDDTYSIFRVKDPFFKNKAGVYAYIVRDEVAYIGRCRDSLSKRVDHGYGKIHPKNCYLDGQATNCHLNARITKMDRTVALWFCPIKSNEEIVMVERELIRSHNPPWNIQRA